MNVPDRFSAPPLKLALLSRCRPEEALPERFWETARRVARPDDELVPLCGVPTADDLRNFDAALVFGACGTNPLAAPLAAAELPCMAVEPYLVFHTYHAALYREIEQRGGTVLPAVDPEQIATSLQAVRARKLLSGLRLLVVYVTDDERRATEIALFTAGARERLGVEIVSRSVEELVERAATYTDAAADAELQRWYAEILEGPGEMSAEHMRQVARLYLAERDLLAETGAVGITVDDIGGFLVIPQPLVMPNVTYGPLVADGFLACEEGDVETLASELLLQVGLGAAPTMSNIYLSFRDRFDALASHTDYTWEMEQADALQCLADDTLTAAHFSTSGVLPPCMMEEARYRVRETLPSWPGQSMISSTPHLGPVVMARLTPDAAGVHLVPAQINHLGLGDQYGWYRGRYFLQIANARDFAARCLFQHYALGPENAQAAVLDTLVEKLLRLTAV